MAVLGISAFFHDSAAALVCNGRVVAAAQEERFTRRKGDAHFPREAIAYCLDEGGLDLRDLALVVFYENPGLKFDRLLAMHLATAPRSWRSFTRVLPLWSRDRLSLEQTIREALGDTFRGDIVFVGHHESHAASAFFPSPFEEAAILTLDAVGEWDSTTLGIGRGNAIELLQSIPFPHSLGMLYSAFTYYTGFKVNSGEYKLMGLAPYGVPKYRDLILDELVSVGEDGSIALNLKYFDFVRGEAVTSEAFHELFGAPPRPPDSMLTQREMDLAASIQSVTDTIVLRSTAFAHRMTGLRNLVIAGGVGLNCVANGHVARQGLFDRVWIQPAAGDAGGALGAALLGYHRLLGQPRTPPAPDGQHGSFLGPAFSASSIRLFLDSIGAVYREFTDEAPLLDEVAARLDQGQVVGWFQGRMEYGPRALGSRSILGDPRSDRMQQTMNLKIKFRESFRPFAPCVLQEYASSIFEMPDGAESPYMMFVWPIREEIREPLDEADAAKLTDPDLRVRLSVRRSRLPAITHVDYSARVQTVDEGRHGVFYRLLRRFHERTGCPVLVNTSFNVRGEPIVCNPEDAFRCFMATEMDCLVIERFLLTKADQPAGLMERPELFKSRFAPD